MALSARGVLSVVLIAVQLVDPERIIRCDRRFVELFQDVFDVADERDRRTRVLADLGGIDVNMDQDLVLCDQVRLADGAVRHAGADHDDHIRVIHRPVAVRLAVVADHAVEKEVLGRKRSKSHHSGHNGDIIGLHEFAQLFFGAAQMDAAARADNGPLCFIELLNDLFDLHRVSVDRGLVGADIDGLGVLEFADLRLLYVDRDIDEDGAFTAGAGNVKGLFDDPGDIRGSAHDIAEFYEGLAGAGDIDLLEHVASHEIAVNLSRDAHQRDTVRERSSNSRDQIRRAGAACCNRNADLARDPRVAARLMRRVLFLAHKDRLDIRIQNTVEEWTDCHSRIAEDIFHAFFFQTFHNCIRCYHLCSS